MAVEDRRRHGFEHRGERRLALRVVVRRAGLLGVGVRHAARGAVARLLAADGLQRLLVVQRPRGEEAQPARDQHAQLGPPLLGHEVLVEQVPEAHPQEHAAEDRDDRLANRTRIEVATGRGEAVREAQLLARLARQVERAHQQAEDEGEAEQRGPQHGGHLGTVRREAPAVPGVMLRHRGAPAPLRPCGQATLLQILLRLRTGTRSLTQWWPHPRGPSRPINQPGHEDSDPDLEV
eukprot:4855167-Prymnesium_polylepis.2